MQSIDIKDNAALGLAAQCLSEGGIIVIPTDTVYGLAADAYNDLAVSFIFELKKRPSNKALPIFVRDIAAATEVAVITPRVKKFLTKVWPGPLTVVLPLRGRMSALATAGTTSIALRIPDQDFVRQLLDRYHHPLAVTSVNESGQPELADSEQIKLFFKNKTHSPQLLVDAGKLPRSLPSTIIDLTEESDPKILRQGSIDGYHLINLFKNI